MGLDMYLRSLPRIEGMEMNEILIANARMHQHEQENSEVYQKIKPHIKHFEEFDMKWRSIITHYLLAEGQLDS
jgi:asparagine synthetase B (glutamine-hydrolysing)